MTCKSTTSDTTNACYFRIGDPATYEIVINVHAVRKL